MIKKILLVLVLINAVFFSSTAWGEILVKDYKKLKQTDKAFIAAYINGVGNGIDWSNTIMKVKIGNQLYCPPEKLALSVENYIRILDDEIEKREKSVGFEKVQEEPIEMDLLLGLLATFPCK